MEKRVEEVCIEALVPYKNNARVHSPKQVEEIARSIKVYGFTNPVLADEHNVILAGHGRVMAAKLLGMEKVPVLRIEHLTAAEKKAYILADNKLAEKAGWDRELLAIEFQELMQIDVDFDLTLTGFETPEIDIILDGVEEVDKEDILPEMDKVPERCRKGDLWQLGEHRLYIGDALEEESYRILLGEEKADLVFTDPPYNVKIEGNVADSNATTRAKFKEFAFASGEMNPQEFVNFLNQSLGNMASYAKDGSIHYVCMDWRHMGELQAAGEGVYTELKNVCVWNKGYGGMGLLYRSQHEMVFVFKKGEAPHTNNIELGKYGRYRTNVWNYPGMRKGKDGWGLHPTVKPVRLIADAIMDCSKVGDLILDGFGGSGSTLLAAEKTKRRAALIEFDPRYGDVILYRWLRASSERSERGEKLTKRTAEIVSRREALHG